MNDRIERETVPQMEGWSCHTYRDVQKYPKTRQEFDTTKPKNIRKHAESMVRRQNRNDNKKRRRCPFRSSAFSYNIVTPMTSKASPKRLHKRACGMRAGRNSSSPSLSLLSAGANAILNSIILLISNAILYTHKRI